MNMERFRQIDPEQDISSLELSFDDNEGSVTESEKQAFTERAEVILRIPEMYEFSVLTLMQEATALINLGEERFVRSHRLFSEGLHLLREKVSKTLEFDVVYKNPNGETIEDEEEIEDLRDSEELGIEGDWITTKADFYEGAIAIANLKVISWEQYRLLYPKILTWYGQVDFYEVMCDHDPDMYGDSGVAESHFITALGHIKMAGLDQNPLRDFSDNEWSDMVNRMNFLRTNDHWTPLPGMAFLRILKREGFMGYEDLHLTPAELAKDQDEDIMSVFYRKMFQAETVKVLDNGRLDFGDTDEKVAQPSLPTRLKFDQ